MGSSRIGPCSGHDLPFAPRCSPSCSQSPGGVWTTIMRERSLDPAAGGSNAAEPAGMPECGRPVRMSRAPACGPGGRPPPLLLRGKLGLPRGHPLPCAPTPACPPTLFPEFSETWPTPHTAGGIVDLGTEQAAGRRSLPDCGCNPHVGGSGAGAGLRPGGRHAEFFRTPASPPQPAERDGPDHVSHPPTAAGRFSSRLLAAAIRGSRLSLGAEGNNCDRSR